MDFIPNKYKAILVEELENKGLKTLAIGRVIQEHKDRYVVITEKGEIHAELLGNYRYRVEHREDLPVVGDYVALNIYDEEMGLIHDKLSRQNLLKRQAIGKQGEVQAIAANIDFAFVVIAPERDFRINRLERYLVLCRDANITVNVVLTKIDLMEKEQLEENLKSVAKIVGEEHVFAVSNETGEGLEVLKKSMLPHHSYCVLGSSGVGKSSLINHLKGEAKMLTQAINSTIDRGKHTTTHRELIFLPNGSVIIDNPGMREVGMTSSGDGLVQTFEELEALTDACKFTDCSHTVEKGCALLEALATGAIDQRAYDNYMRLQREQEHYATSEHERRKKEKAFGRMVKDVVQRKKGKY